MESLVREGMLKENMVSIRMDKRGAKPSGGLLGRGISEVGNYGEFVIGGVEERWIRGGREALGWVPVASSLYWYALFPYVRLYRSELTVEWPVGVSRCQTCEWSVAQFSTLRQNDERS